MTSDLAPAFELGSFRATADFRLWTSEDQGCAGPWRTDVVTFPQDVYKVTICGKDAGVQLITQVWDSERGCYVDEELSLCDCLGPALREGLEVRQPSLFGPEWSDLAETG